MITLRKATHRDTRKHGSEREREAPRPDVREDEAGDKGTEVLADERDLFRRASLDHVLVGGQRQCIHEWKVCSRVSVWMRVAISPAPMVSK